ncbi:efflux RND transporter permease subunit [Methylosinus sp. H3A]|uniref:efflux RND transporter permease subunit n=1 Tax=Methylosinus sp. H3A TaxID=2785786 RepID=UPI001FF04D7E|nr:efflux RND transporter permease subunit [Methylosinus sp. H3A]
MQNDAARAELCESLPQRSEFGFVPFSVQIAVEELGHSVSGANIVETVDRVRALMPALSQALPADLQIDIVQDRTLTIRNSLHELELALLIAIILVIVVVFAFLRDGRVTLGSGLID